MVLLHQKLDPALAAEQRLIEDPQLDHHLQSCEPDLELGLRLRMGPEHLEHSFGLGLAEPFVVLGNQNWVTALGTAAAVLAPPLLELLAQQVMLEQRAVTTIAATVVMLEQ